MHDTIYITTIHFSALLCFLLGFLLIARHKSGERSRLILAAFTIMSGINYAYRAINIYLHGDAPLITSPEMLFLGVLMIATYMIYPAEVVSPGYITWKRLFKWSLIAVILFVIYLISLLFGVVYYPYPSILSMLPDIGNMDVWFRIVLCLVIFLPPILVYFVPYTKKYNNADMSWLHKYVICIIATSTAYTAILVFDRMSLRILYYYVDIGTTLYIVYIELFVRLVKSPQSPEIFNVIAPDIQEAGTDHQYIHCTKKPDLFRKLDNYMNKESAWSNPDLSMTDVVNKIGTNRTTLAQVIQENGFDNYASYINQRRIKEFVSIIRKGETTSYQDAFYDVGFRSKATALRNFRHITGLTPSEYFNSNEEREIN